MGFSSNGFSLVDIPSSVKWLAGVMLVSALIGGGYGLYRHGKTVATLECQEGRAKAIETAIEVAKAEWKSAQDITSKGIANVNNTQDQIRIIRETRIETIQSPNCTDLGPDFAGVYNDTIGAIKAGASSGRNLPAPKVSGSSANGNATGSNTTNGSSQNR